MTINEQQQGNTIIFIDIRQMQVTISSPKYWQGKK
jgi:hypothetical protein